MELNKLLNNSESALIIFIKNPVLGTVKTRIAQDAGDENALAIYKRLLKHTRTISAKVDSPKYLYYSDEILNDDWSEETFIKKTQRGTTLGERMLDAFIEVLSHHKRAVIIGSDCIYLSTELIQEALNQLNHVDKVIGPAKDGGYYLLGMKQVQMDLFIGIPWSSGSELEITKQRILANRSSLYELPELTDIDHLKDWEKYLRL